MNLLRNFIRARLASHQTHLNRRASRRDHRQREWRVTVPAPRTVARAA